MTDKAGTGRPPYRLVSKAGGHEHHYQGQTLRHSHPGGGRPHGYFEHHEDGVHVTCDHEATGWAGKKFTEPGEITVPAELIKLADGERVTATYNISGTTPILTIGVTTHGSLLYGVRAGKGWAFEPQWIGRCGLLDGLQDTLAQVRAEQAQIDRGISPSPPLQVSLRDALAEQLAGRGPMTLREVEAHFPYTDRSVLIDELARMRDDGEVEFWGPRYRLVKG